MSDRDKRKKPNREQVIKAVRDSWCAETCGDPADWSAHNPSWQQCDVSAFVAWEHLGGELVLGEVFLDGEKTELHYWNRIDGHDVDVTGEQFVNGEVITEVDVLSNSFVRENAGRMQPDVLRRLAIMRELVDGHLAGRDALPR